MLSYRIFGASLGWFTILAQYWLTTSESGLVDGSIYYFGFFSILGNILVALAFTAPLAPDRLRLTRASALTENVNQSPVKKPEHDEIDALASSSSDHALAPGRVGFFERPDVRAAIGVYIFVVAVIFYLLLRQLYHPQGLGWLVNILLHYIMPPLYLLDWLVFAPKRGLKFRQIPLWLIFPLAYAAYTLLHGAASGYYPYPFLNAATYGYGKVLTNIAGLTGLFIIISAGFIAIGRLSGSEQS